MYQKVVNPINLEYDVCQQLLLYLFIKTFSLKKKNGDGGVVRTNVLTVYFI